MAIEVVLPRLNSYQNIAQDGYSYCEFEGGNISWDISTDAYVVKLNNVDSTPEPKPADMRKNIKVLNVEVNDYGEVGFVQLGDEVEVKVTYQNLRGTLNAVTPEVVTCYISGLHSDDKIYSFDPVQLPIPAAGATREETIKITLPANNLYLTLNSIQVAVLH